MEVEVECASEALCCGDGATAWCGDAVLSCDGSEVSCFSEEHIDVDDCLFALAAVQVSGVQLNDDDGPKRAEASCQ